MNYEKENNNIEGNPNREKSFKLWFISSVLAVIILLLIYSFINENEKNKNKIQNYQTKIEHYEHELEKYKAKSEKDKKEELRKLIRQLQPKIDPTVCDTIINSTYKYSQTYDLPPKLIISIMYRESTFDPYSLSSADCVGLMQINPKAHHDKIKDLELTYPQLFFIDNNIKLGCMIFREYFNRYNHNIYITLKRYVGGKHDTYSKDILSIFTESFIGNKTQKKRK